MTKTDKFDYFKLRDKFLKFIFTLYYKIRRYFYRGNFTKKHLTFGIVNGKLQITSTNHDGYIVAVQKKINKLAKQLINLSEEAKAYSLDKLF